jgi:hypothetical protein
MKNAILSLATMLGVVQSKLYVYGPETLKEKFAFKDGAIKASYSNFGHIPYGQSIIGRIYYNENNKDGCEPTEFTEDFTNDPDNVLSPIFLVYRGGCTFVKKTRNILNARGALAVIIDSKPNEDVSSVVMTDDSTGMGISIPAMLISFEDGQMLVDYLTQASEEDRKKAALAAEFTMKNPDNRVEYDVWYTSIDDRARDFFSYFQEYDQRLGDKVLMTPHFFSWPCPSCDSEFKKRECVSDGKYCASSHKYTEGVNMAGREIILEDLRQKCIYDLYYKKDRAIWWNYMKQVHADCYT